MLLAIGIVIGLVLGLTGAGGSVFAVPLLMLFAGFNANDAMGLALGAVALSAGFGIFLRIRSQQFHLWPALLLASTGVISAPLGKALAQKTPELWLESIFTLLALALAIRMWQQSLSHPEYSSAVRASSNNSETDQHYLCRYSRSGQLQLKARCLQGLLVAGLLVGFASGFLGVGGGFLIIPILLFLSPMPMAMAVGTSLLIIAPVSLSGFVSYGLMQPAISLQQGGLLGAGAVLGMVLGSLLTKHLPGPLLQRIFAASLLVLVLSNLVFSRLL